MANDRKRGRPKGTGINDHETLLKIAGLIATNPKMKRTTAIKEAGITNPSVIRRLRDKYQEQELSLLAVVTATQSKAKRPAAEAPTKADAGKKSKPGQGANATTATAQPRPSVKEEPIAGGQQAKSAGHTQAPAVDPLAAIFEGLSIETLVTQFIGHVLGISAKDIENSPVTAMIRQQAQLVDTVLPLLLSQFGNHTQAAKAA